MADPVVVPEQRRVVKHKKITSPVWEQYHVSYPNGQRTVKCKHCPYEAAAPGSAGTTNYKRHTESCLGYKEFIKNNPNANVVYDHDTYVLMFADSILYHGYCLSMVEHIKTRDLHRWLNPNVKDVSRYTITKCVMGEHEKYKKIVFDNMQSCKSRICLTCDGWTACTTRSYFALTAHFIDDDWKLHSLLLNFRRFPPPHDGESMFMFVKGLLNEWNIGRKVFSITLDNASSNNRMVEKLKRDLHSSSPLPLDGKYFHMRCCAHILNLIVKKGLKLVDNSVTKLREVVIYVDSSDFRLTNFEKAKIDKGLQSKGKLVLDVSTRWNSTYDMIHRALEVKDAIDLYLVRERDIDVDFISDDEWDTIQDICDFLEPFYEITKLFSGSKYPTANLYLSCIICIEKLLTESHQDPSDAVRKMAAPMWEMFDKYWSDHSMVLSFAFLLDPRFKMTFLSDYYSMLYVPTAVEQKVNDVLAAFVALYECYMNTTQSAPVAPSLSNLGPPRQFQMRKLRHDFPRTSASRTARGDVDSYLAMSLVVDYDGFDVLEYWKGQSTSHPTLALMARDILAIPITSVASESAFSVGGRILNKLRSSLLPKNVEILVTTRNWLFGFEPEENAKEILSVVEENNTDHDDNVV